MQGMWYDKVSHQQGTNISYKLLIDYSLTYVYFHLVVTSKFPMLLFTTRKGVQRFCMSPRIRDILLTTEKICNLWVKNEKLPTSYDNLVIIHFVAMPLACSLYIYIPIATNNWDLQPI